MPSTMQPMSSTRALGPHEFSTSTFCPGFLRAESEDVLLQPFSVSVWFSGAIPRHLAHSNIPIKISVSLNEEYQLFTVPVIEIASKRSREPSNNSVASSQYEPFSASDGDTSIPFLPLPSTFNHMDSDHWAELSSTIQSWLVTLADTVTPEWTWGRDAFWYAFVAANPDFPNGKWAFWNPSIPLEGQFIEEWSSPNTLCSFTLVL
ncbi:uncharacterized protein EDB93DRAFT_1238773 [Suillus bovinus]|uniref:uncharacterized protein n=1 Tax=Suillus bovinus TaxID=48563 RepID=UPI001B862A68|nr:uncharacterized protein EDB93DRAFT_1238773 [Suillus bovinus]KAG2156933.1 hypothetical protein EDB93DRAFT_1238773 [Suillus bovinus]